MAPAPAKVDRANKQTGKMVPVAALETTRRNYKHRGACCAWGGGYLDGKIDKSVSVPLQRMLERRDVALVAEKQQAGECIHQTALQGGSVAKVELAFSRSIIEGLQREREREGWGMGERVREKL
jgi:hypothetical protein